MHQAGQLDHDANCRSLELFATEVMPEFVEGEDAREAAKAERLAPAIEAALGPQDVPPDARRDPRRRPYGRFSHFPTAEDRAIEAAAAADTLGALGVTTPPGR